MPKVLKPGSIKDPDRMFNDLAQDIGKYYAEIGVNLGLKQRRLDNELDSGHFMMLPDNKKAMKMLTMWKQSVTEESFTYSALAAALEKDDLLKECADKYCYIESGYPIPSTVNVFCEDTNYDLCEEVAPSAASGFSAFVNTHLIWEGRKELYVKFMNVQDFKECRFNKQNILGWANSWRDKEPCKEADKVIPKFVECVERDAHSDIRVKIAVKGSEISHSEIGTLAEKKNEHTMFLNLSNGNDKYTEHTVVHEFGHALGMLHEHQRPEIWRVVKKYLAPGSKWYKENKDYKGIDGAGTETSSTYDTKSVMHYPNFKFGLKYKTIEEIETDHLNPKDAVVLKAIVSMDGTSFCTKPSDIDIDFLRQKYEKGSKSRADKKQTSGTAGPSIQGSESGGDVPPVLPTPQEPSTKKPTQKELMRRLKCVAEWHHIGVQLEFKKAYLNEIKQNYPNDNRSCLDELMGSWLERGDASWESLVAALKECRVDKEIIDSIISDYKLSV